MSAQGHVARPDVVTPEAVPLEFATADVGSRALALALDLLLTAAVMFALILAAAWVEAAAGPVPGWFGVALVLVLVLGVQFGYPIAFETLWRGRTLGKAALGLRVVTVEGGPVGLRHATIRAVLGLVDFWITSGAAAVISVLVTPRSQRLGDLAAGTLVLRERSGLRPPVPVAFVPPPHLQRFTALLDVTGITPEAYGTVRAFLMRAASLPPAVRTDLARRLVSELRPRIGLPTGVPPGPVGGSAAARPGVAQAASSGAATGSPSVDDHTLLVCVAAAYQARHGGPLVPPTPTRGPAPAPPPPGYAPAPPGSAPPPPPAQPETSAAHARPDDPPSPSPGGFTAPS